MNRQYLAARRQQPAMIPSRSLPMQQPPYYILPAVEEGTPELLLGLLCLSVLMGTAMALTR
jgi:hypothetical protein